MVSLLARTNASIRAAVKDKTLDLTISAGPIEALRILARKIDTEDALRDLALSYAEEHHQKPPAIDNVSIPTYLKFCAELRLTPASRADVKREPAGGNLAKLRSVKVRDSA